MQMNKHNVMKFVKNYFLILIGTFILAAGTVLFLTKCELVAGGVSGISIIIQHCFPNVKIYDIIVAILTVLFWILGLIFVGKDFSIKTLFSSLAYVGFTFIFTRIPFFDTLANTFAGLSEDVTAVPVGNMILCAIFAGVFVGMGVALTFLGGGSSGGVDVIQFIGRKYFNIKESYTSFAVDATVIITGMIVMRLPIQAACGIISAFLSALLIDFIYIRGQSAFQVDLISEKWETINEYVLTELDRSTTIFHVVGGYSKEDKVMLRIVITRMQYDKLRTYIAEVDPKAFVTFTPTDAVFGEGFKYNHKKTKIGFNHPNKKK